MIKIEGKVYENEVIEISWGRFSSSYLEDGIRKRRTGICPFFNIEVVNEQNEEISFGVETTISVELLNDLKIGNEIDMKENQFKFRIEYQSLDIIFDRNIEINYKNIDID